MAVGLLERWDAANQRTLEYQNDEQAHQPASPKALVITWVAVSGLGGVLDAALSAQAAVATLCVLAVACLVVTVVVAHRRRRDWDRRH
jgi:Flp pilus assembly protein TadB